LFLDVEGKRNKKMPRNGTDLAFKITFECDTICETARRFPEEWRIFDVVGVNESQS
jgi:hypothetical protein